MLPQQMHEVHRLRERHVAVVIASTIPGDFHLSIEPTGEAS